MHKLRKSNLSHHSTSHKNFSRVNETNSLKTISRLHPQSRQKNPYKTIEFTDTFRQSKRLKKQPQTLKKSQKLKSNSLKQATSYLQSQNQKIRLQIQQFKNDFEGNRQNIKKLVKTLTIKKLGIIKKDQNKHLLKINKKQQCTQTCKQKIQMQKQLIKMKLKRYQLEKQQRQFLEWQNKKKIQFYQLKKIIQQLSFKQNQSSIQSP